jgi:two-component system, OmpR family, response regulator
MPHLLLVEDDDLLRDGLSAQLTLAGHTVTVASNGAVAVSVVDTARLDGVILDLGLPLIGGLDVLAHIRQHHTALPVLVLTARDGIEDRVAGLNAGVAEQIRCIVSDEHSLLRPVFSPALSSKSHALCIKPMQRLRVGC